MTSGPLHGEGSAYPAGSTRESVVTETEPRSPTRTLVASFLFTDLVGFSIGSAAEQYAAKATLSAILRRNLAALREVDYRIKDTGDGALIAFVSNPEHALYMALAIAQDFGRAAADAGFPSNSLRTGLHLGSVKESIDLEARPNFVGDGINAAKRIMDFAAPGRCSGMWAPPTTSMGGRTSCTPSPRVPRSWRASSWISQRSLTSPPNPPRRALQRLR